MWGLEAPKAKIHPSGTVQNARRDRSESASHRNLGPKSHHRSEKYPVANPVDTSVAVYEKMSRSFCHMPQDEHLLLSSRSLETQPSGSQRSVASWPAAAPPAWRFHPASDFRLNLKSTDFHLIRGQLRFVSTVRPLGSRDHHESTFHCTSSGLSANIHPSLIRIAS